MKTLQTKEQLSKYLLTSCIIFMISLFSNTISAQETVNVKGVVKSNDEALADVSIYVKGSSTGTVSKSNGSFT